jgi:hypothetical protein
MKGKSSFQLVVLMFRSRYKKSNLSTNLQGGILLLRNFSIMYKYNTLLFQKLTIWTFQSYGYFFKLSCVVVTYFLSKNSTGVDSMFPEGLINDIRMLILINQN